MEMLEIIGRLEASSASSRTMDADIYCASNGYQFKSGSSSHVVLRMPIDGMWIGDIVPMRKIPRYTSSIDSALTLVPEGWTVANLGQNDTKGWWCELRRGHLTSYNRVALSRMGLSKLSAATALCIAALKARYAVASNNSQTIENKGAK